jgi:hypothetical protein
MLLKFSIIFTTAFLAVNLLYSTFASPMVSIGGVAGGHSFSPTHPLAKRDYVPADHQCDEPDDWVGRSCNTTYSDRAWEDMCLKLDADDEPIIYVGWGFCPIGLICVNTLIESTSPFGPTNLPIIVCIVRPNAIIVMTITTYGPQQNGVEAVGVQTGIADPSHTTVSVTLSNRIPGASVSALLEGTYYLNCPICPHLTISLTDWQHTKA